MLSLRVHSALFAFQGYPRTGMRLTPSRLGVRPPELDHRKVLGLLHQPREKVVKKSKKFKLEIFPRANCRCFSHRLHKLRNPEYDALQAWGKILIFFLAERRKQGFLYTTCPFGTKNFPTERFVRHGKDGRPVVLPASCQSRE